MQFTSPGARVGHAWEKSRGKDGAVDGGLGRRGMAMGRLGLSVAEAGSRGRERTVDVSPGARRTACLWTVCGFWEDESQKVRARGED